MNKTEWQFSFTCPASSTSGRAKGNFAVSAFMPALCKYLIFAVFVISGCKSEAKDDFSILSKCESNYAAAAVKPSFIPLPAGAITPDGWIKDWAEEAANGITGHLDEYSITYAEGWKGHGFTAKGTQPDGTGWPIEQTSYWLDGAVRLAYILNDTALINKVSKRLNLVVDGVLNGGESFIYWLPDSVALNTKFWPNFNNWGHSHMGRALVAYYQATQDPRILEALVKVYRRWL